MSGLMIQGFRTREAVGVHSLRDRNPAYVQLQEGAVRNGYTLKLANHGFENTAVQIRYPGVAGAVLTDPGHPGSGPLVVNLAPNVVTSLRLFVSVPASFADAQAETAEEDDDDAEGRQDATFQIIAGDRTRVVETAFDYGSSDR